MKAHRRIKRLSILVFIAISFHAFTVAQIRVTGKVTSSDDGEPLPGVNVVVQNTNRGVATDIEGNYALELTSDDKILVFSYIGYVSQVVNISGLAVRDVILELDLQQLDEIVVVGYGTIRKSDLTGSIASIKSEEIIKAPSVDAIQSLQGKVAGLQILSGSGAPGSESYVRLRGITTLNDNRVLYVVDGVIIDGGIGFLNSQDIESIEVLKDASSKAIFGTRGAAGVIIVTTKKSKGEAKISFSTDYSVENVNNRIGLMSGPEFATFINEVNPGTYNNLDALPDVDWQDLIFEEWQPIQNYTLSASGSTEKINYYFSGGYFKHDGVIPKSKFERITLKLNSEYQVKDYLKLGTNLTGVVNTRQNTPGVISPIYWAWPINDPFNADGTFGEVQGAGNPLAAIDVTNSKSKELRLVGNIFTEISFLKNFAFKTSYQFDIGNDKSKTFVPVYFVSPTQQNEENDLTVSFGESRRWIFENTLNFNKQFDKHSVDAVIGYSAQEDNFESLRGRRDNLLGEIAELQFLDAGSNENQQSNNGGSKSALTSVLFRVNYTYDQKYLATLTFRRDGSSKFGIDNRFANFPAIALGWNISKESFFPTDFALNQLKLRASWGVNGNQRINGNDQYSRIEAGIDGIFGDNEAINSGATLAGQPGNSSLGWERSKEYDVGLEFGVFESRLTAEIDYYNRLTDNILVKLDLPGYAGAGAFVQKTFNAADVRNSGVEFIFSWQDEIGKLSYGLGINGSTLKNKVESLGAGIPGAGTSIISGDLGNGQRVTITEVNQSIGSFYGYKVIGVFQDSDQLDGMPHFFQQGVGDFIYEDINNDGLITTEDRTIIGSWIPDFVYGFNANVGFKGINVSFDFAGQSGNQIYNGKQAIRFSTLNYEDKFLDRWTGPGSSNTDPRASLGGINYQPSDYFLEDASFIKLRTVTLGYTIPSSILDKFDIKALSIYLRGTNLWTSTKYSGYTPEIGGGNSAIGGVIDLGVYPTTRVVSAGLNLTF